MPPSSARPGSGLSRQPRLTNSRSVDEDLEDEAWAEEAEAEAEAEEGAEAEEAEAEEYMGSEPPEEDRLPSEEPDGEPEREEEGSPEHEEEDLQEMQGSGEEDVDLPQREDDLALEEVPEEMREPVEGNLKLRRILSTESQTGGSATKRRRLNGNEVQAQGALEGVKAEIMAKWRLNGDAAARYVLDAAETEDVEAVLKSHWHPKRVDGQRSCAEQISERFIRLTESKCPPGGIVDAVAAFKHRWKLANKQEELLRSLCHKDLRYVMSNYDETRPLEDIVDEAGMTMPDEERTAEAAPHRPGPFTLSRFNRLELIDPIADALVVGDANLTFSQLLAEHREGLGHVGRIVATTFETIETLRHRYREIDTVVKTLEEKNAEVLHNVDCTRLAVDPRFKGMASQFGAVYYNFPHAGVIRGFFDGHPFVRWRHENLMHLFFRALRAFVKPGGVVKVSSNSNATGVRYSDIMMAAKSSEFEHVETVPFLEWQLRGYRRSYGDRRDANRRPEDGEIYKDQRAHSDMVYCFRFAQSDTTPPKPRIRFPPAKSDLLESNEGRFRGLSTDSKKRNVEEMYQLFLSYVQGIHIG